MYYRQFKVYNRQFEVYTRQFQVSKLQNKKNIYVALKRFRRIQNTEERRKRRASSLRLMTKHVMDPKCWHTEVTQCLRQMHIEYSMAVVDSNTLNIYLLFLPME